MATLDFKMGEKKKPDPIRFRIYGTDLLGDEWEEWFECVNPIPAGAINLFVAALGVDEQGNRVESAPNLLRLFDGVLREHKVEETAGDDPDRPIRKIVEADDVIRFKSLMSDKTRPVGYTELADVATAIMEEATGESFR